MTDQPDQTGDEILRMILVADLPPGVHAVLLSPVRLDEIEPGESVVDAMARLGRAVALRE